MRSDIYDHIFYVGAVGMHIYINPENSRDLNAAMLIDFLVDQCSFVNAATLVFFLESSIKKTIKIIHLIYRCCTKLFCLL